MICQGWKPILVIDVLKRRAGTSLSKDGSRPRAPHDQQGLDVGREPSRHCQGVQPDQRGHELA